MKAGDVFVANTPEDLHVHGHRFELVREEDRTHLATLEVTRYWISRDLETGEERAWVNKHFGAALKPEKK